MEGNTKNTGLVIALVIFIVVSLGLGGFIGYDKLINIKSEKADVNEYQNSETTPDAENGTNKDNDSYQVLELAPIGGTAVMYNGEVYVNVYDSTPNIDNVYRNGKFQTLIATRNNYQEYSFGNLIVTVEEIGLTKWLKLNVSDVKLIHNNNYGQALSSINPKYGIVMVNSDSSVSYIGIGDLINGNTNPTKLDVTNVSNVVTENIGGYITYLVKNDGTKTDVNTLIK